MSAVDHAQHGIDVYEVDRDRVRGNAVSCSRTSAATACNFRSIGSCDGHFRTRLRKREGDAATHTAAGARDERPATGEREGVAHG